MRNNPDIPNELYYLDNNFSVQSLRKYQLKEILTANNIPYLQTITREDLVTLFKKHIEPRREEILKEYKLKEQKQKEEESKVELGRGHRATQKPEKFENEIFTSSKRSQRTTTNDKSTLKKDKEGFAIPSPRAKRAQKPPPKFTAEDSFGEEEDTSDIKNRKSKINVAEVTHEKDKVNKLNVETEKSKESNDLNFNPEDSFASSDESEQKVKKERKTRTIRKRTIKTISRSTNSEIQEAVKPVEKIEQSVVEEEDDLDYQADSDASNDEAEDLGQIDKEEIALLRKEQSIPVESVIASNHTVGGSIYAIVGFILFSVWLYSIKEWLATNLFVK